MYLFLLLSHLLHRYWVYATLMIPADVWPCDFLIIISFAPSSIAHPVNGTWTPAIDKKVINIGARKSVPLVRPEQIEELIL